MDPMFRQVMEATRFGGRTSTSGETTCSTSVLVGQTPKNGVVAGLLGMAKFKKTHFSILFFFSQTAIQRC